MSVKQSRKYAPLQKSWQQAFLKDAANYMYQFQVYTPTPVECSYPTKSSIDIRRFDIMIFFNQYHEHKQE
jgi:hypothetical protein